MLGASIRPARVTPNFPLSGGRATSVCWEEGEGRGPCPKPSTGCPAGELSGAHTEKPVLCVEDTLKEVSQGRRPYNTRGSGSWSHSGSKALGNPGESPL